MPKKLAPVSTPSTIPIGVPKNAQPQPNKRNTANPNYVKPGKESSFKSKT